MNGSSLFCARSWCALGVGALLISLSGCHIHNTMPPPPEPPPASGPTLSPATGTGLLPTTDASTTFNVSGAGASVPLASMGLGGTLQYSSNNVLSAAGTFTLTTTPPTSVPGSTATNALVFFEVKLNSNLTFTAPFTISPVVFPDSYPTSGVTFTQTFYDQTTTAQIGSPVSGVVNGQSVTFTPPRNGSFNATANDVYLAVVTGS